MKNRLLKFFSFVVIVITFFSCTKTIEPIGRVAILFPIEENVVRWQEESLALQNYFLLANFKVSVGLSIVADGIDGQAAQIDKVRSLECDYLILASVDTKSELINTALAAFRAAGGRVLCYDRLQQNSVDVDYYITALPEDVGALQGEALSGAVTSVEFLAGPMTDANSELFFNGMKNAIKTSSLTTRSARTTFAQVAQPNWTSESAYQYTKSLLTQFYSDGTLPSAIVAANDAQAEGVARAVKEHQPAITIYPIITGQDNTLAARKRILEGQQTMTVDKNPEGYVNTTFALVYEVWVGGKTLGPSGVVSNGAITVPYTKITPKAIYKTDLKS